MNKIQFDQTIFENLYLLPKKTKIDQDTIDILRKSIIESEKNEFFWANNLIDNPRDRSNFSVHHSSRMLRCSLVGFYDKVVESIGTENNPEILENSVELIETVNEVSRQFNIILEKNGSNNEFFELKKNTQKLEKVASDFIKIARDKDFLNTNPQIIKEVKESFSKVTSEIG